MSFQSIRHFECIPAQYSSSLTKTGINKVFFHITFAAVIRQLFGSEIARLPFRMAAARCPCEFVMLFVASISGGF